jgi:glucan-binding YG repeat protein
MGALKDWVDQDWVRIGTDGSIKGPCGTSKDKKNPDRCLPRKKARSLSKAERAKTARKKKRAGAKGKTVVSNTKKAKVRNMESGGVVETNSKRKFNGKNVPGTAVARGCGKIMSNRRKRTRGAVSQS